MEKQEGEQRAITIEEIEQCENAWKGTLEHFGIHRPIMPFERMKIATLIKSYDYKSAIYALTGMRFETKTPSFDPSKHVALSRVQQPHLFEKFLNLAAQKKHQEKKS